MINYQTNDIELEKFMDVKALRDLIQELHDSGDCGHMLSDILEMANKICSNSAKANFAWLAGALEQYAKGDVITVPAGTGTEEEFFAWLKNQSSKNSHVSLGVGNGHGKLFVHGDYDSIKAVQDKLFELEELRAKLAALENQEPVAAQHRFRHPQKTTPGWSIWQPTEVNYKRPSYKICSQGYEVEYRLLYERPVPADKPERITEQDVQEIVTRYTLWRETECNEATARQLSVGWLALGGNKLIAELNADRKVPEVVVPDNVGLIPMRNGKPAITDGMKVECIGEFSWQEDAPYHDEDGDLHDYVATRVVPWNLCKEIYKRMASAALITSEPSHSQQNTEPSMLVPECFKKLYDHARGMRFGTDWNNGTAARRNRQPLIDATLECEKWLAVSSSHSQQSAEYRCHKCGAETPPPEPFKAYVKCACGTLTAATAALADDRCPSHESEDNQNVSQRDQISNLQVECNRLKQVIDNAYLCFQAAYVEGWLDDLSDGNIDNIRDIWHRRIVYAMQELESAQEDNL